MNASKDAFISGYLQHNPRRKNIIRTMKIQLAVIACCAAYHAPDPDTALFRLGDPVLKDHLPMHFLFHADISLSHQITFSPYHLQIMRFFRILFNLFADMADMHGNDILHPNGPHPPDRFVYLIARMYPSLFIYEEPQYLPSSRALSHLSGS